MVSGVSRRHRRILELMLIIVAIGMAFLLSRMVSYKIVVLNLFFLPIVLSAYYLGRNSAGILALFSTLAVTIVTVLDGTGFASYSSPLVATLGITVWASVLGLTAILVGTLCEERAAKVKELHDAYVGVVDVLSQYLQGGCAGHKARSVRVAEMSQRVGEELHLSPQHVDDIRVAALLYDLSNVEVTARLIKKAVGTLEETNGSGEHTFLGEDLAHSLGTVLHGAIPILLQQNETTEDVHAVTHEPAIEATPVGARIIGAVREYDTTINVSSNEQANTPEQVIGKIREQLEHEFGDEVLAAMQRVIERAPGQTAQPALLSAAP